MSGAKLNAIAKLTRRLDVVVPERYDWAILVALMALAHIAISFIWLPWIAGPFDDDDYLVLEGGLRHLSLYEARPLSTGLARLMGEAGWTASYLTLNFFVATIPALVLIFVRRLFSLPLSLAVCGFYAVMVFGNFAAYAHAKYLGTVTHLTSHFFGLLCLLCLLACWRRPGRATAAATIVFFFATAFSKEDFLLPPFLLLAWLWLREPHADRTRATRRALTYGAIFLVIAALSLMQAFWVQSWYLNDLVQQVETKDYYKISFDPLSIIDAFKRLTYDGAPLLVLVTGLGLVAGLIVCSGARLALCFLATTAIVILLPYSVVPNAIWFNRPFIWIPWGAVILVTVFANLWSRFSWSVPVSASAVLLGLFLLYSNRSDIEALAKYLTKGTERSLNMLEALERYKGDLAGSEMVGVVGLKTESPFQRTQPFLWERLGLHPHWVVFVEPNNPHYPINDDLDKTRYRSALVLNELCAFGNLPTLYFAPDGSGRLTKAQSLCLELGLQ